MAGRFDEYYKNPEKTGALQDEWFTAGDLA